MTPCEYPDCGGRNVATSKVYCAGVSTKGTNPLKVCTPCARTMWTFAEPSIRAGVSVWSQSPINVPHPYEPKQSDNPPTHP